MVGFSESFKAHRRERQAKRASNRAMSGRLLRKAGIDYESKNSGVHLIVRGGGRVVDFWPGTGRWIDRDGGDGRGVRSLIAHLAGRDRRS